MDRIDTDMLRQIPLFELLDEQELEALSTQLTLEHFLPSQVVFTAGEEGGEMYIIQKGRVEIFVRDVSHERVTIDKLGPGEIFGELSLLDNEPRSASAKALDDTTLIVVDRDDLLSLIRSYPASALDMMSMLGKRIRATDVLVQSRVIARNVNEELEEAEEKATFGDRLAEVLTTIASDIRFTYFNFFWFTGWIAINMGLIPFIQPFDPFPFGLLTMMVSLEAIFLSLFVLISQNRQAQRDHVRNDIEYRVNLKAELEIRELHNRLEDIEAMLVRGFSRGGNGKRSTSQLSAGDIE
jgi:uncharacterized membrane protein